MEAEDIIGDGKAPPVTLRECFFVPNGKSAKEGKWLSFSFSNDKPIDTLLGFLEVAFSYREGSIQRLHAVGGSPVLSLKVVCPCRL